MKKALFGSLFFVGIFNLLFYPLVFGIGIGVFFLLLTCYLFLVRSDKAKNLPFAYTLSLLSIFFAFGIGIRANGVVQGIDLLLVLFLTTAAAYFYKKEAPFSWSMFSFLFTPFLGFVESVASTSTFLKETNVGSHSKTHARVYGAIGRGFLIALPILFVLYLLLSGADPIFAKLLGKISFTPTPQMIISVVLFCICFFWGITTVKDRLLFKKSDESNEKSGETIAIESLVVVGSAAALFAVFLFIQLEYLFIQVPETQLHELGINIQTYSEYVRQGFFQLLIAAAIVTVVLAYMLQYLHAITSVKKLYLQIGMILLTLETELLLVSAGKRLLLYADAHGLTRSRIFGFVFLLWLSLILLLFFVAVFKRIKTSHFFIGCFSITMAAFVFINLFSMDKFIATKYPPTINNEVDTEYIMRLSPEAALYWVPFMQDAQKQWKALSQKQQLTEEDYRKLSKMTNSLYVLRFTVSDIDRAYSKNPKDQIPLFTDDVAKTLPSVAIQRTWQAWNMSEYEAYVLIQENKQLFSQLEPLIQDIEKQQQEWREQSLPVTPVQTAQ